MNLYKELLYLYYNSYSTKNKLNVLIHYFCLIIFNIRAHAGARA